MLESKEELKLIAVGVNEILSRYIKIHDATFKFSFRKIIPLPFIFKPIDFGCLHSEAEQILSQLETYNQQISDLIGALAEKESRFARFLSEYCVALIDTVSLLKGILQQLCLKSEGSGRYSLAEYNRQCDLYKTAVYKYTTMGDHLNDLYQEMR